MRTKLIVFAAVGLSASLAFGQTVAYQVPAGKEGTQNYGGSLGMDFIVNTPIRIVSLGDFDDTSDGINLDLGTALWSRDTNGTPDDFVDDFGIEVLGQSAFTNADPGTLIGGSRFQPVEAFVLAPGDYTIAAWGFGDAERNGNVGTGSEASGLDDGGGAITFVGGSRFGDAGTPDGFPASLDGGPVNRYDSGSFQFEVVPEPTGLGLFGLSALLLMVLRRRR